MTSPDRFVPERAIQPHTVYKLGEVTKESVALQQSADMRDNLQELFDTFFDNLFGGFGDVVQAVIAGINDFIHDLLMLLDGFTGGLFNLDNLAAQFNTTRSTAQTAQTTATAAQTAASSAVTTATAAQTDASNAASVAAAAQETADIAYANAQNDRDGFAVSTAGVLLGKNEETQGILMNKPAGRRRIIERLVYTMYANTATNLVLQLVRKDVGGTETVVHTTTITTGALVYPDNTISHEVVDLDRYCVNVLTLTGGIVSSLHCWIESVIVEDV